MVPGADGILHARLRQTCCHHSVITLSPKSKTTCRMIKSGLPERKKRKNMLQPHIHQFWDQRQNFYIIDDVIMMLDCVLVPECLRRKVIESLHAAHQGETSMSNRARESVYWPGITHAIELERTACYSCNHITPSQPRLSAVEPHIPTTPFEAIC